MRQCGQLLSQVQNGTTTKSPGANARTSSPTSTITPTISCPIVEPGLISLAPRYGHRSDPQMQPAVILMTASVGAVITGRGRSSSLMSPGAWIVVTSIP